MSDEILSMKALLIARMYLYELFHKVFGGMPSHELGVMLVSRDSQDVVDEYCSKSSAMSAMKSLLQLLDETFADPEKETTALDLAHDEYTRLFYGPNKLCAYPFETAYRERKPIILSANTLAVRRYYEMYGYECAAKGTVAEDHVSIMCSYMAKLSERTNAEFDCGNRDETVGLLQTQRAFIAEHMANWLPEFASNQALDEKAETYPILSAALSDFVLIDLGFIDEALEWIAENDLASLAKSPAASFGETFGAVMAAYRKLEAISLFGLDENELRETSC